MNFLQCLDKYLDLREQFHTGKCFHGTYYKVSNVELKNRIDDARKELEVAVEKMLKHSHCTGEL